MAGSAQTVSEDSLVTLSSAGSSDLDGDTLTMSWTQVAGFGPSVVLANANTTSPTFTAPSVTAAQGMVDLKFQLVVNDGNLDSGPSTVLVHVTNVNDAPTANAGPNQNVNELAAVTLDGTLSSDPDGDALTYAWAQILGTPTVALTGATTATPTFTAPELTTGGIAGDTTLTFQLTVNDGQASSTSTVNVRVSNVNHAPLADAGPSQTVPANTLVTLTGANSADPDNDALTYVWMQTDGPGVTLTGAATATPSFTAPFVTGAGATLEFQLIVSDPYGESSTATMTVTVVNRNDPPTLANPRPSLATLWPPNHHMVLVSLLGVADPNNNATIQITGVRQDEPTSGLGDGDTAIDAIINTDGTVLLRAERSGTGNGRVYHLHFTASDSEGSVSGMVTVGVPHDKKGNVAIDGGELFDSTR